MMVYVHLAVYYLYDVKMFMNLRLKTITICWKPPDKKCPISRLYPAGCLDIILMLSSLNTTYHGP